MRRMTPKPTFRLLVLLSSLAAAWSCETSKTTQPVLDKAAMREGKFGGLKVRITGGSDREGGGRGPLVVLLHGFGAPGDDLVGLWRVLDVPRDIRFAFPEAPHGVPGGLVQGRAWWHLD